MAILAPPSNLRSDPYIQIKSLELRDRDICVKHFDRIIVNDVLVMPYMKLEADEVPWALSYEFARKVSRDPRLMELFEFKMDDFCFHGSYLGTDISNASCGLITFCSFFERFYDAESIQCVPDRRWIFHHSTNPVMA